SLGQQGGVRSLTRDRLPPRRRSSCIQVQIGEREQADEPDVAVIHSDFSNGEVRRTDGWRGFYPSLRLKFRFRGSLPVEIRARPRKLSASVCRADQERLVDPDPRGVEMEDTPGQVQLP